MSEAIVVYECPECGLVTDQPGNGRCGVVALHSDADSVRLHGPIQVFRDEDVRPLWEALRLLASPFSDRITAVQALDAFPAPEEWKR